MSKTEQKKEALLVALEMSLGVVTTACKRVGITRGTYYNWLKDDKKFREAVQDINNIALDFAESKLYELIKTNNVPATLFYLKTKGKSRGYIERSEVSVEGNFKSKVIEWTPAE